MSRSLIRQWAGRLRPNGATNSSVGSQWSHHQPLPQPLSLSQSPSFSQQPGQSMQGTASFLTRQGFSTSTRQTTGNSSQKSKPARPLLGSSSQRCVKPPVLAFSVAFDWMPRLPPVCTEYTERLSGGSSCSGRSNCSCSYWHLSGCPALGALNIVNDPAMIRLCPSSKSSSSIFHTLPQPITTNLFFLYSFAKHSRIFFFS